MNLMSPACIPINGWSYILRCWLLDSFKSWLCLRVYPKKTYTIDSSSHGGCPMVKINNHDLKQTNNHDIFLVIHGIIPPIPTKRLVWYPPFTHFSWICPRVSAKKTGSLYLFPSHGGFGLEWWCNVVITIISPLVAPW